ncbi:MAG: bifunctional oligoribonuclease/PAP phosphatase NrnA [Crocinitomicaceae bacterium]|jgi:phosphoesterase RecJ-like protein|tara:strand:+ start:6180 stop:7160 length:981 start_codon:yes stop_codon:yes gene_type:complete
MKNAFKTLLNAAENILITTHKSPDGDAVGSAAACARFLEAYGKKAIVLLPDPPAPNLMTFLEGISYDVFADFTTSIDTFDLMFCLDYNHPYRVGEAMESLVLDMKGAKIMIDHHPNPTEFCDLTISRPDVCSTAQLFFEVLEECDLTSYLTKEASEALYLGIMTDTGSFRFPSVTSKTHDVLNKLLTKGVKAFEIHEKVFDQNTKGRILLRAYAISNKFEQIEGTPIAYMSLSQDELTRFSFQKGDTEGLVNIPLSIAGISISVFMVENEEGKVKMSFRSKGDYFVNEFAQENFNGGGHKYAAGGFSHDNLQQTMDKLISLSAKLI